MGSHIDKDIYECQLCDSSFLSKLLLDNHIVTHEIGNKFKCNECDQSYRTKKGLSKHMRIHKTVYLTSTGTDKSFEGIQFNNPNNDCYINAAINCFFSSHNLMNKIKNADTDNIHVKTLQRIIQGEGVQYIQKYLKQIHESFKDEEQHDTQEFLIQLIDIIKPNVPNSFSDYNIHSDTFLECQNCGYQRPSRSADDNFLILPAPMTKSTLQDLINHYYQPAEVENIACTDRCISSSGSSNFIQKVLVRDPPNVIIIQLRRYLNDDPEKIKTSVIPSTNIDFHGVSYRLKAIINHEGDKVYEGHYTTTPHLQDNWVKCNDKNINVIQTPEDSHSDGYVYVYEVSAKSMSITRSLNIDSNVRNDPTSIENTQETISTEKLKMKTNKRKAKDQDITIIPKKNKYVNNKDITVASQKESNSCKKADLTNPKKIIQKNKRKIPDDNSNIGDDSFLEGQQILTEAHISLTNSDKNIQKKKRKKQQMKILKAHQTK